MENLEILGNSPYLSKDSISISFLDQVEMIQNDISKLIEILEIYDSNFEMKNYEIEIEFDLLMLNAKFLQIILSSYHSERIEPLKIRMMKLYDYVIYEFKRLRNKYEDINDYSFSIDEENKYITNINLIKEAVDLKPTKMGCLYVRLLNYYVQKISIKLSLLKSQNFKIKNNQKEKFIFNNNKIHFLCRAIGTYLIEGKESMVKILNNIQTNEMFRLLKSEITVNFIFNFYFRV
jgi:hypothetical protein